jgi:hypothetical protein
MSHDPKQAKLIVQAEGSAGEEEAGRFGKRIDGAGDFCKGCTFSCAMKIQQPLFAVCTEVPACTTYVALPYTHIESNDFSYRR